MRINSIQHYFIGSTRLGIPIIAFEEAVHGLSREGATTFSSAMGLARAGDEVVQLYVKDLLASVARPVVQREGFSRVHLEPGQSRDVSFTIGREQLQMLDREMHWIVEPGTFRVMIGPSPKDIRLRGELVVQ